MLLREFKLNKMTGAIILGTIFLFSVLSTTACSPQFNRSSKKAAAATVAEAVTATPLQLLDGASQGSLADVQTTASFTLSKVSVGGSFKKAPHSGAPAAGMKMHGGFNHGL